MTKSTELTKPEMNSVSTNVAQKRIIKINQCPTVSNNSTLTYHVGCDDDEASYFSIC